MDAVAVSISQHNNEYRAKAQILQTLPYIFLLMLGSLPIV
jgi:hypothetical protein